MLNDLFSLHYHQQCYFVIPLIDHVKFEPLFLMNVLSDMMMITRL